MSCCGGNCGCGSSCKCGNGCGGCKMYPDMNNSSETAATGTVVVGVAPQNISLEDGSEMGVAPENDACKCGPNCKCNPCDCK